MNQTTLMLFPWRFLFRRIKEINSYHIIFLLIYNDDNWPYGNLGQAGRLPDCHLRWHILELLGVGPTQRFVSPSVLTPVSFTRVNTYIHGRTGIRTQAKKQHPNKSTVVIASHIRAFYFNLILHLFNIYMYIIIILNEIKCTKTLVNVLRLVLTS